MTLIAKLDVADFRGYWVGRYEGMREKYIALARMSVQFAEARRIYVNTARHWNHELVRELVRLRKSRQSVASLGSSPVTYLNRQAG